MENKQADKQELIELTQEQREQTRRETCKLANRAADQPVTELKISTVEERANPGGGGEAGWPAF
jgi:hypothetical protein